MLCPPKLVDGLIQADYSFTEWNEAALLEAVWEFQERYGAKVKSIDVPISAVVSFVGSVSPNRTYQVGTVVRPDPPEGIRVYVTDGHYLDLRQSFVIKDGWAVIRGDKNGWAKPQGESRA